MADKAPTPTGVAWALWGGDSGRAQVERLCAAMDATDEQTVRDALRTFVSDAGVDELARDLRAFPYLPPDSRHDREVPNVGPVPASVTTSKVVAPAAQMEKKMPRTLSPETRALLRDTIAHTLDGAEMQARIAESAPEALRGVHRDAALRAIDSATEQHRSMCAADGTREEEDEGEMRAVPPFIKDEEVKRAMSTAYGLIGKLPRTAASVCRDALGTDAGSSVMVKLSAMQDDRADLVKLRDERRSATVAAVAQEREELINHWSAAERAVITPAKALEMRGFDPATYSAGSQPTRQAWTLTQIRQYVQERAGAGPVAEIVRAAPLQAAPGAQPAPVALGAPLQPAAASTPAWQASGLVRMGGDQGPQIDLRAGAETLRRELAASGPGQQAAANLPTADAVADVAQRIARGEIRFGRPAADSVQSLAGGAGGMTKVQ